MSNKRNEKNSRQTQSHLNLVDTVIVQAQSKVCICSCKSSGAFYLSSLHSTTFRDDIRLFYSCLALIIASNEFFLIAFGFEKSWFLGSYKRSRYAAVFLFQTLCYIGNGNVHWKRTFKDTWHKLYRWGFSNLNWFHEVPLM